MSSWIMLLMVRGCDCRGGQSPPVADVDGKTETSESSTPPVTEPGLFLVLTIADSVGKVLDGRNIARDRCVTVWSRRKVVQYSGLGCLFWLAREIVGPSGRQKQNVVIYGSQ
ncbi:hypothetical protein Pcinc_035810 [Petrolisthes cinctipes]|uniref:Secreted protein n=1 Tax=Petrolisthes cinctipes TaxID=88211 RepID=A0AAE1EMY2_PETCI|nr:hypothetical protein Pcinc_035810 [Petrolisthes cinctipes]